MSSSHQTTTSASFMAIVGLVVALLAAATIECHPIDQSSNQSATQQQQQPQVLTSSGKLMGIKQQLNANNSIYKFLGVPYARAPIGQLRFKRPVGLSANATTSVLDASKFGKTCPQFRHLTRFISPLLNIDADHQTSEDCLQLNIFVPSAAVNQQQDNNSSQKLFAPTNRLPVIVWIPGEGFDFADARQFDGSYLAHKTQSIVITVQYRVGVLGFLQAPKLNITGNMGIYDQLEALRWVQQNVGAFGGDSERVTLMGRFSGSMSISAIITAPEQQELLYGPEGKPLFSRVAMLSGVAVDHWIIDAHQAERVQELEAQLELKSLCSRSQIKRGTCLSQLSTEQLLPLAGYGWRLVLDEELIGQKAPIEAIKSNQLAPHLEAVLLGETGMEGTLCLYRHLLNSHSSNFAQLIEEDKMTSNDLYEVIRDDSRTYFRYNVTETNPIQSALESLISSEPLDSAQDANGSERQLRDKYLNACSSYMVKSHSNRFKRNILARNQLEENRMDARRKSVEVFHYELKYKPTFSLAPDYIKVAAHGDDIPLIFGLVYQQPQQEVNQQDLLVSRKMMSYIGNFVHGNNPLLGQHQTLEQSVQSSNGDNETTSMDETESNALATISSEIEASPFAPTILRRSWSSEAQVFPIELNESDLKELNKRMSANQNQKADQQAAAAIRVFVMAEQQRSAMSDEQSRSSMTIRREDPHLGLWFQQPVMRQRHQQQSAQLQATGGQQQQAAAAAVSLLNESSFMTMLLFSSCIIVFAMMSFCLGLCLMVFRYNLTGMHTKGPASPNGQSTHKFASSSTSSCNICGDDSQAGSLDAVTLTGHPNNSSRKAVDNRGFCQMFTKLTTSKQAHDSSAQPTGNSATPNSATNTTNSVAPTNHQRNTRSSVEINGTSQG